MHCDRLLGSGQQVYIMNNILHNLQILNIHLPNLSMCKGLQGKHTNLSIHFACICAGFWINYTICIQTGVLCSHLVHCHSTTCPNRIWWADKIHYRKFRYLLFILQILYFLLNLSGRPKRHLEVYLSHLGNLWRHLGICMWHSKPFWVHKTRHSSSDPF